jgi:hypothetical protein
MAEIRVNATGALKLYDNDDSHFVGLQAGSISSDVTFTLPTGDGSNGQFLKTDGSGALSFGSVSSALDDITTGDAASTLATSAGNITIDAQGNDTDIIFKGTDGSSDTTFLTIDGSDAGTLIANHNLELGTDSSEILFGADNEVKVIHNADKGLILKHTATADDKPVILTLQTGETDMAANDVIGKIEFQAPDESTGTDAILVSGAIQAVAEGDHSSSSNATRLEFMTGASEAATSQMTISSGGIVGIGAGVPGDLGVGLHIKTADSGGSADAAGNQLILENSGNCGIGILSGTSSESNVYFGDSGSPNIGYISYNHNGNSMAFAASGGERVRIKQYDFCVGTTSPISTNGITFKAGTTSGDDWISSYRTTASTPHYIHAFYSDAGGTQTAKYAIYADGAASSISDVNYKKNITNARNYLEDLEKIDVIKYNLKTDNEDEFKKLGFSAQQVETIFPNMIDADNTPLKEFYEEGDEIPEGKAIGDIKKTTAREVKLLKKEIFVPMLVKAVQELSAKIKTLETKVTTLEG